MSSIPSGFGRVPNLLVSQVALGHLSRTNAAIFRVNSELSTGRAILRPSDDPVRTAAISAIDERLETSAQRMRNLSHADAAMGVIDSTLSEINDLILSAKQIAQEQINFGASGEQRRQQAGVVQSIIDGLLRHANQETVAGFVFGGAAAGRRPVVELLGGYRSVAVGTGLVTDLGPAQSIPLSLGQANPIVGATGRVRGIVDLAPVLTMETRLDDLAGARGLGVGRGAIEVAINGSPARRIDLSDADTVGDVAARIHAALLAHEDATGEAVVGSGGVGVSATGLTVDLAAATPPGTDPVVVFSDIGAARTAADLGLVSGPMGPGSGQGDDLGPRLTMLSPVSSLGGLSGALGSITISNGGLRRVVDLSGAEQVQDIKALIEAENLGLRVEIDPGSGSLTIVQELASVAGRGLWIADASDGTATATALGIRTFGLGTRLDGFNDGRGVGIQTNGKDPVSGLPDPARDVDFAITLGDGTVLRIDLGPSDVVTVGSLLSAINGQAAPQLAAAGLPPGSFEARLIEGSGGIELWQDTQVPALSGSISVEARNGSRAAEDLGLAGREYDPSSGTLRSQDRGTVRSLNAFSALLDLREALSADDPIGIGLAGERIERALDAITQTRGLFGGYDRRVSDLVVSEEERQVLDETIRSGLRDTDFASAASRFSLLQTQLQAGYRVVAQASQLSLLDYLR